jgi:putrescine aminotransferase
MDRAEHHGAFGPLHRDVSFVPFGDADALDAALSRRDAAAFVVEPVQGEAGMIEPPPGYLGTARALCARYGTLFVADEVQTGLCRTGRMFALDHELGKALGGGVMPLSALLTTDRLFRAAQGGTPYSPFHESTFAGNTWACAAGMATLEMLTKERAGERAREAGAYLVARLKALQRVHPAILAVRGAGLMIGVELAPAIAGGMTWAAAAVLTHVQRGYFTGMLIRELLVKHRIMTAYTLNNPSVLRLQPPLTVTRDQMDEVVDALDEGLTSARHLAPAGVRMMTALTRAQFTVMRGR